MEKEGIHIDAVTIQNEPLNSRNTPSMPWDPADQAEFIRDHLGPIFEAEGIDTDIVVFDHNCDRPDYALAIYNDPKAEKYVAGSGYHHYRGDLSAMSYVYEARPDKDIYFTEQMTTERPGTQQINIASAVNRLIIGITRNWSKNVVLWNLAADPLNDPHTDNGGCSMCQGAITIDGDIVTRNIAYYVIAHASKLVPPGSKRIFSTAPGERIISIAEDEQHPGIWRTNVIEHANVPDNVTFMTPQGKVVMIVSNDSWSRREVNIQYNGKFATLRINPGSVATYIWDAE
jgi:glucosylceramidase